MMSFFKKENKEDKERKKLEKKFIKDSTSLNSSTLGANTTASNSSSASSSNVNLSLNLNDTTSTTTTTEIHSNTNHTRLQPGLFQQKQQQQQQQQGQNSAYSSSSTSTSTSTSSSSSSSLSPGKHQQHQHTMEHANNRVTLPIKPKKGILKTMSKFTIGPTLPSFVAQANKAETPVIKRSVEQVKTPATGLQHQQSIVIVDNSVSTTNPSVSPTLVQVKFKRIASYLDGKHDESQPDWIESSLVRTIVVALDKLATINLTSDDTDANQCTSPIIIECNDNLNFLPGDQLLAINEQSVLEKSISDVKKLVKTLISTENPEPSLTFRVRTNLACCELVFRNVCDGTRARFGMGSDSLKRTGSLRRKQPNANTMIFNQPNLNKSLSNSSVSSSSSSSMCSSTTDSTAAHSRSEEMNMNNVWLIHSNGYSAAKIFAKILHKNVTDSPTGGAVRFKVRLENGNLIEVNEEMLEKANPSPQFDYCEDISSLRFINETSILHCVRQRYHTLKLIHTYIGSQSLLVLKPSRHMIESTNFRSIYNDKVIGMFKGCKQDDMPPHVYSYVQSVYRNMLSSRQDQSIVLMGHSASGKTTNSKFILNYLFKVASNNANFSEEKLNAMFCILNAFGSIRTDKNQMGANRFMDVFLLEFNHSGLLVSLLLQLILFDQTRLFFQSNNESNFLIFYHLLFGANELLKNDLHLNNEHSLFSWPEDGSTATDTGNLLFHSAHDLKQQKELAAANDLHSYFLNNVIESFKVLGFEETEIRSIFHILGALVHLGRAGAVKSPGVSTSTQRIGQFKLANEAHLAANLLGVSFNQLNDYVFTLVNNNQNHGSNQPTHKFSHLSNQGASRLSPDANGFLSSNLTPGDCLSGFCLGLYQECINLIVNCINRSFRQLNNQPISNSMLIIDPPGFRSNGAGEGHLSYSDLVCNYLSERLQLMFYQINFINPIEKCAQEGLDVDLVEHIPESPSSLVNWFDKPPPPTASMLHRTNYNSSSNEQNYGLLWQLEEQMNLPDSATRPSHIFKRLGDADLKQNFITTSVDNGRFTVHHQFGQFPVEYNLDRWFELYNKEYATQRNASVLVQNSKKDFILCAFLASAAMSNAAASISTAINMNSASSDSLGGSSNSTAAANSLKRQASVRKMLTLSKRKSFSINLKLQIDSVFDSLRKTKANFIFCLLASDTAIMDHHDDHDEPKNIVDEDRTSVPLLRMQLKAYQLLPACRIYRQGYPEFMNFEEFERRFVMFMNSPESSTSRTSLNTSDIHKQACLNIIKSFDLDSSLFKIGNTQVFFKAGVLNKLEDQRDEKINHLIVKLQSHCRCYLATKSFEKKRLQYTAIKCLQKNIRIWYALKKWPWWRLYTNLKPIVNVQANETLLKQYKDELDELKRKNERLTNEKSELKLMNNQLESKLMNLQTEYVEEHAANAGTIDLLEVETSERIRLERELNELRPLYNETVKKLETLETEMLELRLYNTKKSIEQELEKDGAIDLDAVSLSNSLDTTLNEASSIATTITTTAAAAGPTSTTSSMSSMQVENLRKEIDALRAQIKEDKRNFELFSANERSFFENKLKEKDVELLELEKQASINKRKYQKACEEMQDLQRMCDEYKVRNRELEKLQAKFDQDMNSLKTKLEAERELRERCERERDASKYEIFTLKSDLDTQKLETNYHVEKCERLERDLKEYETTLSLNGASTNPNGAPISLSAAAGSTADNLIKSKSIIRDLEAKMRDQEEELDEQALVIQQLEQAKLRLEMQLEKDKQKWQREIAEKESEMDDLRFHTQKKIKSIEMQLEEESEMSSSLQREKRDLERKLRELLSNGANGTSSGVNGAGNSAAATNGKNRFNAEYGNLNSVDLHQYVSKLKRQMLKYKTLAIDAQTQLEKLRENIPKQSIFKALKSQLEDSEITKANALKAKQLLQVEIENLQQQLDESNSYKLSLEEQVMHLNRELNNLKSELEEQERDADEVLKKYQNHVQNYTLDSHRFIDLNNQIDILTIENRILKEKIREMEEKISFYENSWVEKTAMNKIENKIRDLECKLEFETTHKTRVQNQLERVKQQYENSLNEIELILAREKKCEEQLKRAQRSNKETLEEFGDIKKKLIDLEETKKRLEQQNEILERELETSKNEINVNQKRLEAFQNALNEINNEDESNDDDDDDDDDEEEEDDQEEINDDDLESQDHNEQDHDDHHSKVSSSNSFENGTSNGNHHHHHHLIGDDIQSPKQQTSTNGDIMSKLNRSKLHNNESNYRETNLSSI